MSIKHEHLSTCPGSHCAGQDTQSLRRFELAAPFPEMLAMDWTFSEISLSLGHVSKCSNQQMHFTLVL